jgi:hypothetical protein
MLSCNYRRGRDRKGDGDFEWKHDKFEELTLDDSAEPGFRSGRSRRNKAGRSDSSRRTEKEGAESSDPAKARRPRRKDRKDLSDGRAAEPSSGAGSIPAGSQGDDGQKSQEPVVEGDVEQPRLAGSQPRREQASSGGKGRDRNRGGRGPPQEQQRSKQTGEVAAGTHPSGDPNHSARTPSDRDHRGPSGGESSQQHQSRLQKRKPGGAASVETGRAPVEPSVSPQALESPASGRGTPAAGDLKLKATAREFTPTAAATQHRNKGTGRSPFTPYSSSAAGSASRYPGDVSHAASGDVLYAPAGYIPGTVYDPSLVGISHDGVDYNSPYAYSYDVGRTDGAETYYADMTVPYSAVYGDASGGVDISGTIVYGVDAAAGSRGQDGTVWFPTVPSPVDPSLVAASGVAINNGTHYFQAPHAYFPPQVPPSSSTGNMHPTSAGRGKNNRGGSRYN